MRIDLGMVLAIIFEYIIFISSEKADPHEEIRYQTYLSKSESTQRRILGWLDDESTACRKGCASFPRDHRRREVPGSDLNFFNKE